MNYSLYADVGQINEYASSWGHSYWTALSTDLKNRCAMTATQDIEAYHKQARDNSVPWELGCITLAEAAVYQALYLGRTIGQRDANDSLAALGGSMVNDGVTMIGSTTRAQLDYNAKNLVLQKMQQARIPMNQYGRG